MPKVHFLQRAFLVRTRFPELAGTSAAGQKMLKSGEFRGQTKKQSCVQLWPWLLVITGYKWDKKHSINGVFLVLITGISGLNCTFSPNFRFSMENLGFVYLIFRHSHFAFTDCQLACQQGLPGRVAAVLWLQSQRKSRNSNAIEKTSGFVHILGCKI